MAGLDPLATAGRGDARPLLAPATEDVTIEPALESPSPIRTTLDFERDGKQVGELRLPHSTDQDAWGAIPVPVAVFRNGEGPTALLVGGVHGDEYEGPIVLAEWIRSLDPARIQGSLIILPALNLPAVRSGKRRSPIDGLDLARVFPGDPDGAPTRQIAHYVARELIPRADFVLDLHAGGTSLEIMTAAMMRLQEDRALDDRTEAALRSFGAPLALVAGRGGRTSLVGAAARQGRVSFAVELGSCGRVSARALAIARTGITGLLAHAGILPGEQKAYCGPLREIANPDDYLLAPVRGVFEPRRELGAQVEAGEEAGRIHHPDRPATTPTAVTFACAGMMFARRAPGIVAPGNCIAAVASRCLR